MIPGEASVPLLGINGIQKCLREALETGRRLDSKVWRKWDSVDQWYTSCRIQYKSYWDSDVRTVVVFGIWDLKWMHWISLEIDKTGTCNSVVYLFVVGLIQVYRDC